MLENRRLLAVNSADTTPAIIGFQSASIVTANPSSAVSQNTTNGASNVVASSGLHPYFPTRSLMGLHDYNLDSNLSQYQGSGETVVVISSGIDLQHPFFGPDSNNDGVADRIVYSYDFSGANDSNASDVTGAGTYAASIIASSDSTYSGISPNANIIALKVTADGGGVASQADVLEALNWVVSNLNQYNIVSVDLDVSSVPAQYNTSTVTGYASVPLAALAASNVIVVCRSGDGYYSNGVTKGQGVSYPAADANTVSVGAVFDANAGPINYSSGARATSRRPDAIMPISQRSAATTTIFAPGAPAAIVTVLATGPDGSRILDVKAGPAGTGVAAANVAGIAVLAQDIATARLGRRLTPAEFKNLLTTTGAVINDGDDELDNVGHTGLNFRRVNVLALSQAIRSMASSADIAIAGQKLPGLLGALQTQLNQSVLNRNMPLVGVSLGDTNNTATQFLASIATKLETLTTTNESALLTGLSSRLGTTFTRVQGDPATATQANPVIYQGIVLGTLGATAGLAPDLGLPGLGLKVDANSALQLSTRYSFTLRFGLTNTDFFIDSSRANELTFTVMANMAGSASVTGSLGLLESTAKTSSLGTKATFSYKMDLNDSAGNNDGRITSTTEIGRNVILQANVVANINLDSKFAIADSPVFNPRLLSDLHITWTFSDNLVSSTLGGTTKPSANIDQIRLDLSSFFKSFVNPIIKNIQDSAGPLFVLAEKLNEQVFPNQDKFSLTYLDVLKVGSLTLAPSTGSALDYVALVQLLADLENSNSNSFALLDTLAKLPSLASKAANYSGIASISLGSLQITDDIRVSRTNPLSFTSIVNSIAMSELRNAASEFFNDADDYESDGASFTFDLVKDPLNAFGLLMGDRKAKIFSFKLPELDKSVDWEYYFNTVIYVIPVTFSFQVGARLKGHLAGGFDASGLFDYQASNDVQDILHGLYLNSDTPVLQLQGTAGPNGNAFIYANAGIGYSNSYSANVDVLGIQLGGTVAVVGDVLTFSASLIGAQAASGQRGVEATLTDVDGDPTRFRYSELTASTANGNWIGAFNYTGGIDYLIDAHTRLSVSAEFSIYNPLKNRDETVRRQIDAVNITWASEKGRLFPEAPPAKLGLATLNSNGQLNLSVGDSASNRAVSKTQINESFFVRHLSGDPKTADGETVMVSAFGFSETFTGVKEIVATAGSGVDIIQIDSKVLAPVDLDGGDGNDQLRLGGGGGIARGGIGDDYLFGGTEVDFLYGDEGQDNLRGNGGADQLFGGVGSNKFFVNNDADTINSSSSDTIYGSLTGGKIVLDGGTLNTTDDQSLKDFTFIDGFLVGSKNVTVTGILDWQNGVMQGPGKTLVTSTGSLRFAGNASSGRTLGRQLDVQGASTWTAGDIYIDNGGKFINRGTFIINSNTDLLLYPYDQAVSFENLGTLVKQGTGTADIGNSSSSTNFRVNSTGTIDVRAGRLNLNNGGNLTGPIKLAGSLGLGSAVVPFVLASSATATGTGTLYVDSATVQIAGALSFNQIVVTSNGTLSGTGNLFVNNLTLNGNVEGGLSVNVTGVLDWQGGSMLGLGKTLVTSTGSLRFAGNASSGRTLGRQLDVQGASTWTAGDIYIDNGGKFINRGTFTINSNTDLLLYPYNQAVSFENLGTLVKQGTGKADIGYPSSSTTFRVNSTGTIDVQAGRLNLNNGGNLTGPIKLAGSLGLGSAVVPFVLASSATATGTGTLYVDSATVQIAGALSFNQIVVTSNGTLSGTGNLSVNNLTLNGNVEGGLSVNVTGVLDWQGGSMLGLGKTLVTSTGSLRFAGNASSGRTLGRQLDVQGASTWTAGDIYIDNGGKFINRGTFIINSNTDLLLYPYDQAVSFENLGTLVKQGTGKADIGYPSSSTTFRVNSTGTIDVRAGRLNLNNGGNLTGPIKLAGSLGLGSAVVPFVLASSATATGTGTLYVDSATVQIAGALSFNQIVVTSNGTLSGTGNLSVNNLTLNGNVEGGLSVNVTGVLDWQGGSMLGLGKTLVTSTGSLRFAGNASSGRTLGRQLDVQGASTWTAGDIYIDNGGKFINRGTFIINSNTDLLLYPYDQAVSFENLGTLVKQGTGKADIGYPSSSTTFRVNSTGTIDVRAGRLNLNNGGNLTGPIKLAGSLGLGSAVVPFVLASSATATGTGTLYVDSATVQIAGALSFNQIVVTSNGTLSGTGNLSVNNLTLNGNVEGGLSVNVTGVLDWQGGSMLGLGKTLVTSTGSLRFAGNASSGRTLGRQLDVQGASSWTAGDIYIDNGGKFINRGTFTINSNTDLLLYPYNQAVSFENLGTLVKQGTGKADIGYSSSSTTFRVNSTGTIDVQAGALNLSVAKLALNGSQNLTIGPLGTLRINGSILGGTTASTTFRSTGTLGFSGGDQISPLRFEAMSKNLGYSFAGFGSGFSYGKVVLDDAYVKVFDLADNVVGNEAESVYVESLSVNLNSVLDLTGLQLFTRSAVIKGSVINGSVTIVVPNTAPVIASSVNPSLVSINEDVFSSAGTLISAMLNSVAGIDVITDTDVGALEGISVYSVDNTRGKWQYSTTSIVTWIDFGSVSEAANRLLSTASVTRVRFVPNADFNGTVTFAFRAWDRRAGVNGGVWDVSSATSTGGMTPFSEGTATASLVVIPINDAPVLNASSPAVLTPVKRTNTNPSGDSVSSLVNSSVTDVDFGAVKGIAIVGLTGTASGTWQYSINNGASWVNFGLVSEAAARLLSGIATKIRFVPVSTFTGSVSISYRAWDQTSGTAGGVVNLSGTGKTGSATAFSSAVSTSFLNATN